MPDCVACRGLRAQAVRPSLEWYYQPRDLLSVALFDKRLRDDITTAQTNDVDIGAVGCFNGQPCVALPFSIQQPVNGDKADIYGVELSWQHILDNGFGVHAEYIHTWSKTVIGGRHGHGQRRRFRLQRLWPHDYGGRRHELLTLASS